MWWADSETSITILCLDRGLNWITGSFSKSYSFILRVFKSYSYIFTIVISKWFPVLLLPCSSTGVLNRPKLWWYHAVWKWRESFSSHYYRLLCVLNCVLIFVTLWTVAQQDPLSMEFSRQEYWSGLSFPTLLEKKHFLWPSFLPWIPCENNFGSLCFHYHLLGTWPVVKRTWEKHCRSFHPLFSSMGKGSFSLPKHLPANQLIQINSGWIFSRNTV